MRLDLVSVSPRSSLALSPERRAGLEEQSAVTGTVVIAIPLGNEVVLDLELRSEGLSSERLYTISGVGADDKTWFTGKLRLEGEGKAVATVSLGSNGDTHPFMHGFIDWTLAEDGGDVRVRLPTKTNLLILPEDILMLFPRGLSFDFLVDLMSASGAGEGTTPRFAAASVADLTRQAFNQNPPRYDRDSGGYHYITIDDGWNKVTFHQTRYQNARKDDKSKINCYDCTAYLQVLMRAAGYKVRFCYMDPFGYLKKTPLIGFGDCNNPFVSSDSALVVAVDSKKRSAFGNHAFCEVEVGSTKRIADACAGPHLGTEDRAGYVNAATDSQTPTPPAVRRGTVSDVSDYAGVTAVDTLVKVDPEMSMVEPNNLIVTGTVLESGAKRFAEAIGYDRNPRALLAGAAKIPDPVSCPLLAGLNLQMDDVAAGYPESNRQWRFDGPQGNVTLTAYVSSIGPERAHERFLALGAVYETVDCPFRKGPPTLGQASAELAGSGSGRIFWVQGNVVYDLRADAADASSMLRATAEWLHANTFPSDNLDAPRFQIPLPPPVRVGNNVVIETLPQDKAFIAFALGDPGLMFLRQDERGLFFLARKPGSSSVSVVMADKETLLSTQQIIAISIQN